MMRTSYFSKAVQGPSRRELLTAWLRWQFWRGAWAEWALIIAAAAATLFIVTA